MQFRLMCVAVVVIFFFKRENDVVLLETRAIR